MNNKSKNKLIFIYSFVLIYLLSIGLTYVNSSFVALTLVSMGFIWGFIANELFFKEEQPK